ncbi:hypothetical protein [Alsobacter sp. R-9]
MRPSMDTSSETVTALPVRQAAGPAKTPAPQHPAEVARYVAQITGELSALARSARLDTLVYFLEMARHEAQSQSRTGRR